MADQATLEHLAKDWIAAFNAHDLERILAHYDDAVVLTSPLYAKVSGSGADSLSGKDALRSYFRRGLEMFPELRFTLRDLFFGVNSVAIVYDSTVGNRRVCECTEVSEAGLITRVLCHYA